MSTPIALPYRIGRIAGFALIALHLVWHGWLARPEHLPTWLVLGVTVVPLLVPLTALPDLRRALLWVGILGLFYFCHGVAEAWAAPRERALAWIELALAVIVILACARKPKRREATASKLPSP